MFAAGTCVGSRGGIVPVGRHGYGSRGRERRGNSRALFSGNRIRRDRYERAAVGTGGETHSVHSDERVRETSAVHADARGTDGGVEEQFGGFFSRDARAVAVGVTTAAVDRS